MNAATGSEPAPNAATEESQTDAPTRRARGEFVRGVSAHRAWIGDDAHSPGSGRYHLHVALNCPWCHRVTLARTALGLTDAITMDVAHPNRTEADDPAGEGWWQFAPDKVATLTGEPLPECTRETASGLNDGAGARLAIEFYRAEGSDEKSLPILYDKQEKRIVSNESADIVRMLNAHAEALGGAAEGGPVPSPGVRPDLYPDDLADEIDRLNARIYADINNGAYKAGLSSDQAVYAQAFERYFAAFTWLDDILADGRPFLTGERFTEADLRLFPTLYRHDPVYFVRMKLNGARVLDYPALWRWLCRVHALPGVAEAGSLLHCRQGYFGRSWNRTVPLGPFKPMAYPEAYGHPQLAEGVGERTTLDDGPTRATVFDGATVP